MMQQNTIGKNYETTLKYINNVISEWYVPEPAATMDFTTLQNYATILVNQMDHWGNVLANANSKEANNVSKILDTQAAKLERYNKMIEDLTPIKPPKDGGPEPGGGGGYEPEPTPNKKTNLLFYGLAALVVLLIIKRS